MSLDRRSRRSARHDDDTLQLSFLDVLSCGLGASIALFLAYSVLPHLGTVGVRSADPGHNSVAGMRAGVEDPEAEVARNAVAWMQVKFLPPTGPDLQTTWSGLRSGRSLTYVERDATGHLSGLAAFSDGLAGGNSPRLEITGGGSWIDQRAFVQICVGGRCRSTVMELAATARGPSGTIQIEFLSDAENWIHLRSGEGSQ